MNTFAKTNLLKPLLTNLTVLQQVAAEKEKENDEFRLFLKQHDSETIDALVHEINDLITTQVDCTECGNCCKTLMINITPEESTALATHLEMDEASMVAQYIETSEQGQMIMNTIPCHFLAGSRCSIYAHRFTECREFPHLHKPNFTGRLFGTFMYYAMCPIIYNTVETLKERLHYTAE